MSIEVSIVTAMSEQVTKAFQELIPQLSSSSPPPSEKELGELISSDCCHVFVARDTNQQGAIVGSLTLVVFRIPTGVRAWIEDVVVLTSVRGKGIGEALSRAALDLAAQLGAKTVDLTSRPSREAANRLYRRVGFIQRETNVYRYKL